MSLRRETIAEADRAFALDGAEWDVVEVTVLPSFRLHVRFRDGVAGEVFLRPLLDGPSAGVFAALKDQALFDRATIEDGAVVWPRVLNAWPWSLDLAPDAMHDEIAEHGKWVLT
jgi:hypothetical protein